MEMELQRFLHLYPKRHIIFDFDRTLFTLYLPWKVFASGLRDILSRLDQTLVLSLSQEGKRALINCAIEKYGDRAKELISIYRENFETQFLEGVISNERLLSFIRENHGKYQFSIWSSNAKITILRILKKYDMERFFLIIASADDIDFIKPSPDGFYFIFNEKEYKKSDYLYIGDKQCDEEASKNAGIDFLLT